MGEDLTTSERRQSRRTEFDAPLEIVLEALTISGSGRNLSRTGVLAVVPGGIRVTVKLAGADHPGSVVRLQAMDEKSWSLAIKFDQPLPE